MIYCPIHGSPAACTSPECQAAFRPLHVVQPMSQAVREEMELAALIFADAVSELNVQAAENQLALELANLCM